jgi:hypothetical protein
VTEQLPRLLHEIALVLGIGFPAIALLVLAMFWRGGGGRWRP